MSSQIDSEIIKRFNEGTNPEFLKEIENLFRRPVIVVQTKPVESKPNQENSENPKPDSLKTNEEKAL